MHRCCCCAPTSCELLFTSKNFDNILKVGFDIRLMTLNIMIFIYLFIILLVTSGMNAFNWNIIKFILITCS